MYVYGMKKEIVVHCIKALNRESLMIYLKINRTLTSLYEFSGVYQFCVTFYVVHHIDTDEFREALLFRMKDKSIQIYGF